MTEKKGYSTEKFTRVYNNTDGSYYQIGPDADSLGLIEVIYTDGDIVQRCMILPPEWAVAVANAIIEQTGLE